MPSIRNTTKRPVKVPLPGAKRLFLGPGKTGQVTAKALEHPPLAALIEAGELEHVPDEGSGRIAGPGAKGRPGSSGGDFAGGPPRQSGDR